MCKECKHTDLDRSRLHGEVESIYAAARFAYPDQPPPARDQSRGGVDQGVFVSEYLRSGGYRSDTQGALSYA